MKFKNCLIFDSDLRAFRPGCLAVENGVFVETDNEEGAIDCGGDLIIPGLIDIHTHGRNGFDFCGATAEQMKDMKRYYAEKGVTTVIPSLASAPLEEMLESVERVRSVGFRGVHLEGRYMNVKRKGAHAEELLKPLTASEIPEFAKRAEGMALHVSAAYELDEDGSFLKAVIENGGTASLAHTDATYAQATELVEKGVSSFTHLFNAMPQIHHRAGGAVVAGLLSDAYAEIICDGFHLAPETVKLVNRVKDPKKVILITDSMEGAGCPDGLFHIAGRDVFVKGGKAYTADGTISGSTLNLFDGVKNYAAFSGIPVAEAINAASINPATMLGLKNVGAIKVGYHADFLRVSPDFDLKEVYVAGEKV